MASQAQTTMVEALHRAGDADNSYVLDIGDDPFASNASNASHQMLLNASYALLGADVCRRCKCFPCSG